MESSGPETTGLADGKRVYPVWRVSFTPKEGISVFRLEEAAVLEVGAGEDRAGFLPSWFLDRVCGGFPATEQSTPTRASPPPTVDSNAGEHPRREESS